METDINLRKPTDTREDRFEHNVRDEGITKPSAPGQMEPEYGRPPAMEARASENKSTLLPTSRRAVGHWEKPNVNEPKFKIGQPMGLEEDPHSPKTPPAEIPPSNYQSKVTDPTGAGNIISLHVYLWIENYLLPALVMNINLVSDCEPDVTVLVISRI